MGFSYSRAVELGLTTEDLEAVEERASQAEPKISAISVKDVFADNVSSKVSLPSHLRRLKREVKLTNTTMLFSKFIYKKLV